MSLAKLLIYGFFMVVQCFLGPFYSILLDFLETPRGTAQQPGALLFGGPSLEVFFPGGNSMLW